VLPPDLEARVAAVAADRVSGANELGLRSLEAFEAFCTAPRTADELRELAAKLAEAQPSMAAVRNVAHLCAQLVQEGDAGLALREVRREITEAPGKIARNALKVITGKPNVVTLSRSAAVLATLKLLHARGFLSAVTVLESRPGFEGRRSAEELAAAGIPTRIVVDALGPSIVRDCDAVLVGADSVLRDGALVNKAGTYGLALAAKAAGKPFYAACETMKIDAARTGLTFPPPEVRPARELEPPPNVTAFNAYFDLTPSDLVSSFITDRGVYEPRRIAQFVLL
jgi:translation initiation factor 2B subunit (eIF-2B alpha/beta/delta family)